MTDLRIQTQTIRLYREFHEISSLWHTGSLKLTSPAIRRGVRDASLQRKDGEKSNKFDIETEQILYTKHEATLYPVCVAFVAFVAVVLRGITRNGALCASTTPPEGGACEGKPGVGDLSPVADKRATLQPW